MKSGHRGGRFSVVRGSDSAWTTCTVHRLANTLYVIVRVGEIRVRGSDSAWPGASRPGWRKASVATSEGTKRECAHLEGRRGFRVREKALEIKRP